LQSLRYWCKVAQLHSLIAHRMVAWLIITGSFWVSHFCYRVLCSQTKDFGRRNKRWVPDFRMYFQLFVAQIEYSRPWKVIRKVAFHLLFILPKSSFGEHKFIMRPDFVNEDLRRVNKPSGDGPEHLFDAHFNVSCPIWVLTPLKSASKPTSEQKLRNFRTPYLTKKMSIREYSHLGELVHRHSRKRKWFKWIVKNRPNVSTHVCSFSLLSRGFWNCAIFARYIAHNPSIHHKADSRQSPSRCRMSSIASLG